MRARINYKLPFLRPSQPGKRSRVVILGTGWSSMTFLKYLNNRWFDISVVSPRNYFTFTPLLPAVAAGTLSPLSCIEPVRRLLMDGNTIRGKFYEAVANDIDLKNNKVHCTNDSGDEFTLEYDALIMGHGTNTSTLGIKGVEKYALMLKEVEHATRLKKLVLNNFERASLPNTPESEKKRLLHFVAIGGGPTGVETMAELSDFVEQDVLKHFPVVGGDEFLQSSITVATSSVAYIREVHFNRSHSNSSPNVLTDGIHQKYISVDDLTGKTPKTLNVAYGVCLWAVGNGSNPLTTKIRELIPAQKEIEEKRILTDAQLHVLGTDNLFAIGDCKRVVPPSMKAAIQLFIEQNNGEIPSSEWFRKNRDTLAIRYPQVSKSKWRFLKSPLRPNMTMADLENYLDDIDSHYKTPPATAQNARQEALYLASVFNDYKDAAIRPNHGGPAYADIWFGSLAYVGHGRAVASLPGNMNVLGGFHSHPLWMSVYIWMQLSNRSRAVVIFDWFKTLFCGRDVGREHAYSPGELILIQQPGTLPSEDLDKEAEEVIITQPMTKQNKTFGLLDMWNM